MVLGILVLGQVKRKYGIRVSHSSSLSSPLLRIQSLTCYRSRDVTSQFPSPARLGSVRYRSPDEVSNRHRPYGHNLIHPDIIRFPSSYFYCNNLKSANLIDVKSQDSSTPEMKFIVELWEGLSKIIPEDKTVGVFTNYRYQRDTIRDILMDKIKYSQVISLYSCEGLRDCPIFDVAIVLYSAPNDEANYKILNTLLTRAKSSLILCGYFSIMSEYHFWDGLIEDAKRRQILFRLPSSYGYFACEIIKTKK
ncbi:probable helicase senataxin [Centruroides sculpturatus]|uniref:probable helicase senataxin n=1 Tax=Centruroides sculpturatus TaxID=218467 RepID=UPI000C6E386F|nr:probable helicase senataxin [Centruroides sculpturatus]